MLVWLVYWGATAVKDLQQTVVDEIKIANADGKLTAAEKRRIKDAAVANVKSYLGAKGIRVLSGGALDSFLEKKDQRSRRSLSASTVWHSHRTSTEKSRASSFASASASQATLRANFASQNSRFRRGVVALLHPW